MNAMTTVNSGDFCCNRRNHNHLSWLMVRAKHRGLLVLRRSKLGSFDMRTTFLSLTAAGAMATIAALMPANAMTVGAASGVQAAIADTSSLQDARYVCRHRFHTSRRVCWWRPDRPWRHSHWRSRRW
jgi:hypothetical protein